MKLGTTGQIKDGKRMYRALEAHFSHSLAFYKCFITRFSKDYQEIEKKLKEAAMDAIFDVYD